MQYELPLLTRRIEGGTVAQRVTDGYINATAMCRAAGKLFADYNRLGTTQAFLAALGADMGIPITELNQSIRGGTPDEQGTWVHPQVAINLAQWLSPTFAVQVSKWVFDWMSGASTYRATPIFVQRFNANWDRVAPGYFSVIGELFVRFYGRLEQIGYRLRDRSANDHREIRPDVSVGKIFVTWLEERYPQLAGRFTTYRHVLPEGNECDARQYENTVLAYFIQFVEEVWIPQHAGRYLRDRDPDALPYLARLLPAPRPRPSLPGRGAV